MTAARRSVPGGLRWRLGAWVALVVLALLGCHLRRRLSSHRQRAASPDRPGDPWRRKRALARARSPPTSAKPAQVAERATRYIRAQPFSASSTLLFVIVPGARNELQPPRALHARERGQRRDGRSSRPRRTGWPPSCAQCSDGYSTLDSPDVGDLRLLERTSPSRRAARNSSARASPWPRLLMRREAWRARSSWRASSRLSARSWRPTWSAHAYRVRCVEWRPSRRRSMPAISHPRIHDLSGEAGELTGAGGRFQSHARPSDRGLRRSAGVRGRCLARAAHALDGDPRTAGGARGADRTVRAGGQARGAARAGRDRSHHPLGG